MKKSVISLLVMLVGSIFLVVQWVVVLCRPSSANSTVGGRVILRSSLDGVFCDFIAIIFELFWPFEDDFSRTVQ